MTWLAGLPGRLIAYALALAFAFGGWWMYARTVRAWDREKAVAEGQADLAREMNRGRAKDAAADYRATKAAATARSTQDADRLRKSLQRPIPCPPAASAPDHFAGVSKMFPLADVLVPADTVRVLIDAGSGASGASAP